MVTAPIRVERLAPETAQVEILSLLEVVNQKLRDANESLCSAWLVARHFAEHTAPAQKEAAEGATSAA